MEEQEPKIKVENKGDYKELEKPFGYLKNNEKNYITCFNVRVETLLTEEEAQQKIKEKDWSIITLLVESIIIKIEALKNKENGNNNNNY